MATPTGTFTEHRCGICGTPFDADPALVPRTHRGGWPVCKLCVPAVNAARGARPTVPELTIPDGAYPDFVFGWFLWPTEGM